MKIKFSFQIHCFFFTFHRCCHRWIISIWKLFISSKKLNSSFVFFVILQYILQFVFKISRNRTFISKFGVNISSINSLKRYLNVINIALCSEALLHGTHLGAWFSILNLTSSRVRTISLRVHKVCFFLQVVLGLVKLLRTNYLVKVSLSPSLQEKKSDINVTSGKN